MQEPLILTRSGAAYGTAKAGVGISAMGVLRPDLIVKSTLQSLYYLYPSDHMHETIMLDSF